MKNKAILLSLCALVCACSALEPDVPAVPETDGLKPGETGMYISPVAFADEPDVRSSMLVSDTGLSFVWEESDAVGVYSDAGGFARFALVAGAGTDGAVFDGMGFDLAPGSTYSAFYPYALSAADKSAVAISFAGQTATGDDDRASVMDYDYLAASAVADDAGKASFHFSHLGSFLRMKLSLPAGTSVDQVELVPLYDPLPLGMTVDLATGALSEASTAVSLPVVTTDWSAPAEGPATLWAALPAKDYSGDRFAVLVHAGSDLYSARQAGSAFASGRAFRWTVTPLPDAPVPAYGFTTVTEKSVFEPSSTDVPAGQYSGITWLGGTRYAVVHDKLNGGGIVFFDIAIDDSGAVTSVTSAIPEATGASTVTKMDNEGIAYVPGTPGSLYVSAEKDQSIREYDLEGNPTGRSLPVPADMKKACIASNQGFEALTYNAAAGLFWTVTEAPLLKDSPLGRMLRLQSFTADREAGERFLYRLDAPAKTDAEAAAAKSYVFGVPALAALDDGRLLVLEREVYVPNGSTWEMLANSFTTIKIYAVHPAADGAGVLRKTPVKSFSTTAANLANYEGMCVGPVLPDGSACLVLIPDSQGGSGGLTKEYVKVITVK